MVIKNKIFSSGQVVTIATGQDYTLKDDEVYINNHTYKKRDLEIKLDTPTELRTQEQVKIGVRLRGGMKSLPADFGLYNEWEVDNAVPTSLADAIELITTCIYTSSDTALLAAILAEVQAINQNTDELEDVVRKDIELVPASELSPDGSRRLLQVEYAVTLDGTKTLVGVTELDGSAVTDGSVPVFPSSSGVVKTEIVICVNEKIVHVNDFEDNTTGDFDSGTTFTDAYPPNGIRLELVDGETALDGTFDNLTAKFKHEVSFQLFFDGITTNQLVVEVQDADDNSVLETLTVVENPANDGTYKIEFTAPDSEEIILRFNTSAMDSTTWIDDVVIKRLQTGASLAKRFDEASNELTADRKFFLSGVLIPAIPSDEFSEGSCQVDLSDVIARLEDMIPEEGTVNISEQADISGQSGTITDPSSFSFVWGNNAAGSFTVTNTVTGKTTTYNASSGIAPSNAVDEGRLSLEEHTFDASGASDLWLNVQGSRIVLSLIGIGVMIVENTFIVG